jgi:hypothetical protein
VHPVVVHGRAICHVEAELPVADTPPSLPRHLRSSSPPSPLLFQPLSPPSRPLIAKAESPPLVPSNLGRPCRAPPSGSPPAPPRLLSATTLPCSLPSPAAPAESRSGVRRGSECELRRHHPCSVGASRWTGRSLPAARRSQTGTV